MPEFANNKGLNF